VNWHHFRAFLKLRWRLQINQVKRAGTVNAVFLAILAVVGIFLAILSFFGFFAVGVFALADASPIVLMLVWDGMAGVFLFIWLIALVTDLQRSEALSLEKFLHLPVTPTGVFLINYLSSLLNLRLILFVPAMVGLSLGLAYARGPALLLALPLLAAFLLMVTALTNQFQGWLAALMMNKRRRRAVIVFVTFGFCFDRSASEPGDQRLQAFQGASTDHGRRFKAETRQNWGPLKRAKRASERARSKSDHRRPGGTEN
jgi:ABC-2 type transport system permease protein